MSIFKRKQKKVEKVEEQPLDEITACGIAVADHLMTAIDEKYPQLHCKIEVKPNQFIEYYRLSEEEGERLHNENLGAPISKPQVLRLMTITTIDLPFGQLKSECQLGCAVDLIDLLLLEDKFDFKNPQTKPLGLEPIISYGTIF